MSVRVKIEVKREAPQSGAAATVWLSQQRDAC
jgi:hypothetical protein